MVREVERKQEQESRNQEPSLQDPAQQRCQGGGGGLEEKAVFTVRAAAYFSTHEKAGKGCVFIVLRCRMQRQKSMQIIFFWHSADEKKKKGQVVEFKPQEGKSRIFNSNKHSRYTFLQSTNTGVENKCNCLCFPTTELSFCLEFPFPLKA